MTTRVSRNLYNQLNNCMDEETIKEKYGTLVIVDKSIVKMFKNNFDTSKKIR